MVGIFLQLKHKIQQTYAFFANQAKLTDIDTHQEHLIHNEVYANRHSYGIFNP